LFNCTPKRCEGTEINTVRKGRSNFFVKQSDDSLETTFHGHILRFANAERQFATSLCCCHATRGHMNHNTTWGTHFSLWKNRHGRQQRHVTAVD